MSRVLVGVAEMETMTTVTTIRGGKRKYWGCIGMVMSDRSQYSRIPLRRGVGTRLSRTETTIDGIWVYFLIILLLGLADQDGGKKGRRVGFYWCSRRPSLLFLPLYHQEFFVFYLHIATRIGAGGFWLWLSLLCWPLGHVYTSAVRTYIYLFGDSNVLLSRTIRE